MCYWLLPSGFCLAWAFYAYGGYGAPAAAVVAEERQGP